MTQAQMTFAQGLQLFFIEKILSEKYTRGTEARSKRGIEFFTQWSHAVRKGRAKDETFPLTVNVPPDFGKDIPASLDLEEKTQRRLEKTFVSFAPEPYHDLLDNKRFSALFHLLADEDLGQLMRIEYPAAAAEKVARAIGSTKDVDIPYWNENLTEAHRDLFQDVIVELVGRNPREVKRLLNSALMAGAGTEMMQVQKGKPRPLFEQGLQDYFVRTILQRRYPSLANMIATDIGRKFFADWSRLVVEQQGGKVVGRKEGRRALTPGAEEDSAAQGKVAEELGKNPTYKDYLRLTTDDLLAALMAIPFSAELAERTRQFIEPSEGQSRPVTAATSKAGKSPRSKNETIIREAMARALDKSPSFLTADDSLAITKLNLSRSQVSDLGPLRELTNLQSLNLDSTQISNLGPLRELTSLQLLSLTDTQVSDIEPLGELTNLQVLWLDKTQVSDAQVEALQKALPDLEIER